MANDFISPFAYDVAGNKTHDKHYSLRDLLTYFGDHVKQLTFFFM